MDGEAFSSFMFSPAAVCHTPTRRLGSAKGSGFNRMPSMTLKIAVFAPMPMASVISVMAVNIGARINRRRTCLIWLPNDLMQSYTFERAESLFYSGLTTLPPAAWRARSLRCRL
jgi:hypothetical protein